jgi:CHAT domain-containing protein
LVEVEAVLPRLLHQLAQFPGRQSADRGQRVRADAEQHLVLDDVAHAREQVLVQQGVAHQHVRSCAQPLQRQRGIPVLRHHVGPPVVDQVQRLLDEAHRAGVEVDLAAVEAERQARHCPALDLVDAVAAEQHEMHAQAEVRQLHQEVLAPAAERLDALVQQALLLDRRVAGHPFDALAEEGGYLLLEDDDRRAFGHAANMLDRPRTTPPL